ncbi:MAG TPA: response regulator [Longimicrobiales bacterium]
MADLKDYYRHAVNGRVAEIEDALARRATDPDGAAVVIRRAAHSLRGSGGTYGFPEVSAAAAVAEDADDEELDSAAEALLTVLRGIRAAQPAPRSILIIDDDPEIVLLLRAVLGATGREIVLAASAEAALQTLRTRSFDIALLDLMLPDADGRSVLQAIREGGAAARVIVLSGKSNPEVERECRELGADDYVVKPFDPEALAARVSHQLASATRA